MSVTDKLTEGREILFLVTDYLVSSVENQNNANHIFLVKMLVLMAAITPLSRFAG